MEIHLNNTQDNRFLITSYALVPKGPDDNKQTPTNETFSNYTLKTQKNNDTYEVDNVSRIVIIFISVGIDKSYHFMI